MTEESIFLLKPYNCLFVNFIGKGNNFKGKIYKQLEDNIFEDFNDKEIELLQKTNIFISKNLKNKTRLDNSSIHFIMISYFAEIKDIDKKTIHNLIEKISVKCYFVKYFNQIPDNNLIELIEIGFFIDYIINNKKYGIKLYMKYMKHKKKIFTNEKEFNNFEKLMILMTLYDLVISHSNIKFIRLYDLPISSPFVASEKIYLDIINELNESSCLYFFYLQINSSSDIDFISLDKWYPIKYIPLIEIKTHILYSRFRFCFIYDDNDKIPAFVNPQTLIKAYNVSEIAGYDYSKKLENEKNTDNTAKLLFYKFHENSHSKFNSGLQNEKSPRFLYNFNLEMLDIHYNEIIKYKFGDEPDQKSKKGDDEGEEGYAFEMFLYGNYKKTDLLFESSANLERLCNSKLYSGNNFNEFNKIFSEIIYDENIIPKDDEKDINKNKLLMIKKMNIGKKENVNNSKTKNNIYFFKTCRKEAKY